MKFEDSNIYSVCVCVCVCNLSVGITEQASVNFPAHLPDMYLRDCFDKKHLPKLTK